MNFKFWNKKTDSPKTPKPAETMVSIDRGLDYSFFNNEINVETIVSAISQFESDKRLGPLNTLYKKYILIDDNAGGAIQVRKEALKAAIPKVTSELPEKLLEEIQETVDNIWCQVADLTVEYKLFGFLFKQIDWSFNDNLWTINSFIGYDKLDLRISDGQLRLFENEQPRNLPPLQFIAKYNNNPILMSILKYYTFFFFCLNNWASLTEVFGKPYILGKYQPGATLTAKAELKNLVQSAGSDLAGIISENTSIEFLDFANKTASSDLYHTLIKFTEERVTRRILGQTLTTNAEETGSYAQAKVHNLVRQDILSGDIRDATALLKELIGIICAVNYNLPQISLILTPGTELNLTEQISIDEKLNHIIEIDPEYFYEKYHIPLPKSGPKLKENLGSIFNSTPVEGWHSKNDGVVSSKSPSGDLEAKEVVASAAPFLAYKEKGLNNTLNKIKDLKKTINSSKSFADVKKIPFPTDIFLAFADDMWTEVKKNYLKIRKQNLKKSALQTSDYQNKDSLPIDFEFTDQDIEALNNFRAETFTVAGVNAQQLQDMIADETKKAFETGIGFQEWKENLKLNGFEPENPYHLRTNFNRAIAETQAAAAWNNIQEDKDVFPYLEYITMEDDHVREEHIELHGIVRHVDDPFWDTNYPPNGWGCRCTVEQLTEDEANNHPGLKKDQPATQPVKPEFQRNVGKDNSLFGDWLSCSQAKAVYHQNPHLSPLDIRLFLMKQNMNRCPESLNGLNETQKKDWHKHKQSKEKQNKIDGLSRKELIEVIQNDFGDQLVTDQVGCPLILKKNNIKWDRLNTKQLMNRAKYSCNIEDIVKNPTEIWIDYKRTEPTMKYLKRYSKDLMALVSRDKKGNLVAFNLYEVTDNIEYKRTGVLVYTK